MTDTGEAMRRASEKIGEDIRRAVEQVREYHRRTTPVESWYIPRDQVYIFDGQPLVHPSTMMRLRNNGRVPFWSQYTVGDRELHRDRRKQTRR